jgi:hypothetical protein
MNMNAIGNTAIDFKYGSPEYLLLKRLFPYFDKQKKATAPTTQRARQQTQFVVIERYEGKLELKDVLTDLLCSAYKRQR